MPTFELQPALAEREEGGSDAVRQDRSLSEALLRQNVAWFIRLRCLVVATFLGLAVAVGAGIPARLGVRLAAGWMLAMAAALALANGVYWLHQRRFHEGQGRAVKANLWAQIVVDLLAVTVVVHQVGSTGTFGPLLYVVHIILACIFFPLRTSLGVLLLSMVLYLLCLLLEAGGLVQSAGLFPGPAPDATRMVLQAGALMVLWITIWVLVAYLSGQVRAREQELMQAHETVLATFHRGQQHLRHTAHQMKAPLDAIRSQIGLLQGGYVCELPPREETIGRINSRAESLAAFVMDVLHLARLKDAQERATPLAPVDLTALVSACADAVAGVAAAREVSVQLDLAPATVPGDAEGLQKLVDNLLTNAINYSRQGGQVEVSLAAGVGSSGPVLVVRDHGIGIPQEKLGRIFEEYFRTPEAKRHCLHSTGVGLAIVKQVAATHAIHIKVESTEGEGTAFHLTFPLDAATGIDEERTP